MLEDFLVWALSNLRSEETGVDGAIIWISAGEFLARESQHGPRIMVVPGDKLSAETLREAVTVTIAEPPLVLGTLPDRIQGLAIQFVAINREPLLRHWQGEIASAEVIAVLRPVS